MEFPGRKLIAASGPGVSHITLAACRQPSTGLPPGTDRRPNANCHGDVTANPPKASASRNRNGRARLGGCLMLCSARAAIEMYTGAAGTTVARHRATSTNPTPDEAAVSNPAGSSRSTCMRDAVRLPASREQTRHETRDANDKKRYSTDAVRVKSSGRTGGFMHGGGNVTEAQCLMRRVVYRPYTGSPCDALWPREPGQRSDNST